VLCMIDSELELVDIQNCVYQAVKVIRKPSIQTQGTEHIDGENYTGHILAGMKCPTYCELRNSHFTHAIERKVMGVEELADLLVPELLSPYYLLLPVFAAVRGPHRARQGDYQEPGTGRDGKM